MYSNNINQNYSQLYNAPGGRNDSQKRFQNLGQSLMNNNSSISARNQYDSPSMYIQKHELDNDPIDKYPQYMNMHKNHSSVVDINRHSSANELLGAMNSALTQPNQNSKLYHLQSIREALENDQTRARKRDQYEQYRDPYQQIQSSQSVRSLPNNNNNTNNSYNYGNPNNRSNFGNTMQNIQSLKNDYLQKGGQDQSFLNNISNLENFHKNNNNSISFTSGGWEQQRQKNADRNTVNINITRDNGGITPSYPNQHALQYTQQNNLTPELQHRLNMLESENKQLQLHSMKTNSQLDMLGPVQNMNQAQIIKYLWAQENSLISDLQGINPLSTDHYIKDQQLAKIRELRLALELMHQQEPQQQNSQFLQPMMMPQQQPQVIIVKGGGNNSHGCGCCRHGDHRGYRSRGSNRSRSPREERKKSKTPEKKKKKEPEEEDHFSVKSLEDEGKKEDSFLSEPDIGQPVLVKVMGLINYKGKKDIKCRNCVVDFDKVVNDIQGAPCAELIDLPGQQKGNGLVTQHTKTYNFDWKGMLATKSESDLNKVKWYVSIYDEETGEQFGWILADMFRKEDGKMRINSGRFAQNLLMPPAQKPPFLDPKVNMPVYCDYVIMRYDDEESELELFDLVEEQEDDDEKKILTIEVQALSGKNLPQGDGFSYFNSLMLQEHALVDREGNICESEGNLPVTSQNKAEIKFSQENSYLVSDQLLRNQVKKTQRDESQVFVEMLDKKGNSIGIAPIALFKEDNKTVNRGTHRVQLIKINNQGQEESLDMVLQVRIEIDDNWEFPDKQYDPDKGLLVSVSELRNFKDKFDVSFQVKIIDSEKMLIDIDGHPADFESEDIYKKDKRRKNFVEILEQVEMPVNWKKVRDDCKRKPRLMKRIGIQIRLTTQQAGKNVVFAWFMHPMFTNDGMLNNGKFTEVTLWEPPVISRMPIDFKIKESVQGTVMDYEIDQCRLDDSIIGAVHNSDSEDSLFAEVNQEYMAIFVNYVIDMNSGGVTYTSLAAKCGLVENGQFMKDENGQLAASQGSNCQTRGQKTTIDEQFSFNINILDLKNQKKQPADKYYILISLVNQKGEVQFWGFAEFFNKNYNLKTGQQLVELYLPPSQKPPVKVSDLKKAKAKINFTLRYDLDESEPDEGGDGDFY